MSGVEIIYNGAKIVEYTFTCFEHEHGYSIYGKVTPECAEFYGDEYFNNLHNAKTLDEAKAWIDTHPEEVSKVTEVCMMSIGDLTHDEIDCEVI